MHPSVLARACLLISILSSIAFVLTYSPAYQPTSLSSLLTTPTSTGSFHARITHVIKNYPITTFVVTDGVTSTLLYYPKSTTLEPNEFVLIYAANESLDQNRPLPLTIHKVVRT